ncbi:SDR family NAD(P)-dependent oxidoreductase [Dehalococcoidia bacterium]|nr:SDR family NAD(P)-dependent oxidoreductase [Dehalococcoidia bacterium]
MKVLITGGAGFIGSHTADLLLKRGYEVRILDNLEPPVHRQRQKPGYIPEDIEFILGDVRNRSEMEKALRGVDAVFHLAAYQDYLTDFSRFALVNNGGTALLYEIIVNEHLPIQKVILGSSQAVYGEGKYECLTHGVQYPPPRPLRQLERADWEVKCPICGGNMSPAMTDESIVNPHNQYAVSKYSQELYALTLGKRHNIPTVILRYGITQGPRQSFYNAYSGILRSFTVRLLNNLPPVIYEDGQQRRDYVHVRDVAEANLLVLQNAFANFQVFNVGGSKVITVVEYARLLIALLGKDIEPQCGGKFRFGDTRHLISDISKVKGFGWQPKISLEQIIMEYIEWAQEQAEVSDYYAEAEKVMRQQGVIRKVEK